MGKLARAVTVTGFTAALAGVGMAPAAMASPKGGYEPHNAPDVDCTNHYDDRDDINAIQMIGKNGEAVFDVDQHTKNTQVNECGNDNDFVDAKDTVKDALDVVVVLGKGGHLGY